MFARSICAPQLWNSLTIDNYEPAYVVDILHYGRRVARASVKSDQCAVHALIEAALD